MMIALDGMKRFVMQYASRARVIAPEELRDDFARMLLT